MIKSLTILLTTITLLFNSHDSFAQVDSLALTNSISITPTYSTFDILTWDILGNALLGSINYEHIYKDHFGYRLGLGVTTRVPPDPKAQSGGVAGVLVGMVEYHTPLKKTFSLRSGIGIVMLTSFDNREGWDISPSRSIKVQPFALTATLGLEHLSSNDGFVMSFLLTPICSFGPAFITWWGGISIGFAF